MTINYLKRKLEEYINKIQCTAKTLIMLNSFISWLEDEEKRNSNKNNK